MKFFDTPLMMPTYILDAMAHAFRHNRPPILGFDAKPADYDQVEGIAVIPVLGILAHREHRRYGQTLYQGIRKNFLAAVDNEDVRTILFDIHSPGGEVAGIFDLADSIYNARGQKPIYAIANETALSAAYLIASAADRIFLSRTSSLGSIGVRAVHYEQSRLEKDVGVKFTTVVWGDRKDDYTPHKPLNPGAHGALQRSVDRLGTMLTETVARNRSLPVKTIIDTEAKIYSGAEAVNIGLADEVLPWDAVIESISQLTGNPNGAATMEVKKNVPVKTAENPQTNIDAIVASAKRRSGSEPTVNTQDVCKPLTNPLIENAQRRVEAMDNNEPVPVCRPGINPLIASAKRRAAAAAVTIE